MLSQAGAGGVPESRWLLALALVVSSRGERVYAYSWGRRTASEDYKNIFIRVFTAPRINDAIDVRENSLLVQFQLRRHLL
jgi:hypothetical protein